jgi:hypothetical protein
MDLQHHAASCTLLERKPLRLTAEGRADIPFEKACALLVRDDLLTAIQRSYAEGLPEGEAPEFTVKQLGPGQYSYTNRHGQPTTIQEVRTEQVPGERITIALYSEGVRFFGEYQSLCEVEVVPDAEDSVCFSVIVYARPESGPVRFFARLAPVETYFRHKMKEMTGLVVDVCDRIPADPIKGEEYVVFASK